jgi:hypothetical protein
MRTKRGYSQQCPHKDILYDEIKNKNVLESLQKGVFILLCVKLLLHIASVYVHFKYQPNERC